MNIFRYLSPSRTLLPKSQIGVLSVQRETLLQYVLNLLLAGCALSIPWVLQSINNQDIQAMLPLYLLLVLLFLGLAFVRRINFYLRAGILVSLSYFVGVVFLIGNGLSGAGILLLVLTTVLANFFFDFWIGGAVFLVTLVTFAVTSDLILSGRIVPPAGSLPASTTSAGMWVLIGAVMILTGLVSLISNWVIAQGLVRALNTQETLTKQIDQERSNLEMRVQERSSDLRQRLSQFEVASQIASDISLETDLQLLLENAVKLIRDRFGFYHAGIFLNDERNEYAVLRAATGEAGRQMLENSHRLKIGETGIVGHAISRGEAGIAGDVSEDTTHYWNPFLPETRSEIALPLKVGSRCFGALDVQSVTLNAFTQEGVRILQMVANQLAIAIDKSSLVQDLQENLKELDTIQRQSTRLNWHTHLRNSRRKFAYRYHHARLEEETVISDRSHEAIETGKPVIKVVRTMQAGTEKPVMSLAVPISLRNQVLGVVDIQFESASVSPDLVALIESTVDRLAVSLENARLLEEIQYKAERERLVSEITTKVRASSDVDNILRITAQELGRSLGVSEVLVHLRNL